MVMAVLFLLIVLQRNMFTRQALSYTGQRKQVLMSIMSQKTTTVSEQSTTILRLKIGFTDRLSAIFRVFYGGSSAALIKNLLIAVLVTMGFLAVNPRYIGFPPSWVLVVGLIH